MIKIIKSGKNTRKIITCSNCECKFSYQNEDILKSKTYPYIDYNYVCCPECHNPIYLLCHQ